MCQTLITAVNFIWKCYNKLSKTSNALDAVTREQDRSFCVFRGSNFRHNVLFEVRLDLALKDSLSVSVCLSPHGFQPNSPWQPLFWMAKRLLVINTRQHGSRALWSCKVLRLGYAKEDASLLRQ